ncbi:hypothetical protein Purlil1_9354 [Purpureocillium lilacinum]|uniref:Uncharacterized protein n=1 Tax=Purpureocillium lilacinum TaxID=33203 RepID=A0ABR0BQS0_PURLI|nr:hypothetical protein Purlil1_9354 [Purpureocillium lilacinum]
MAFEAGSGRGVCRVYTRCRAYRPTTAPVRRRVSALVQGPASLMRALDTCTYTFTLSTLSHTCTYSCALFEPLCWDFSLGTPKSPPVGASWLVRHRVLEAVRSAPSWPAWAPVLFLGAAPAPRTFYHYAAATTAVEMQDDGRALSIIVGNTGGGRGEATGGRMERCSRGVRIARSSLAPEPCHAMLCQVVGHGKSRGGGEAAFALSKAARVGLWDVHHWTLAARERAQVHPCPLQGTGTCCDSAQPQVLSASCWVCA